MLAYIRKFIILKKEFATFKGMNSKGHCKLEVRGTRGTMTVNIENAEVDNFYNVILISNTRTNSVWNLGKIFTDNLGKGKGEYVFNQRELESKNFPMDKISAILIVRDNDILLGGYTEKEDGAIDRYIKSMVVEAKEETPEDTYTETYEPEVYEPEVYIEETIETEIEETIAKAEEMPEAIEVEEVEVEEIQAEEIETVAELEPVDELEYKEEIPEVDTLESLEERSELIEEAEVFREKTYEEPFTEEVEESVEELVEEPDLEALNYMKKLNQKIKL